MRQKKANWFARRFIRYLFGVLCTCMVLLESVPVFAAESDPARKTIRVGFFALDGYHMMDKEGVRSGYGYDFLRLAARYLDVDYEYIGYEKSWEEMQQMLLDGEIDLLTSARKTPEREKQFDFSKPIGTSTAILTTRSDNSEIVAQDYSTYNGIRVALLQGNTRNDDFAEFAAKKGFRYRPVYYSMTSDMTEALQKGEVDAIVTSSLRQTVNERVLDKFDSSDFYAIVRKGDTELLNSINYAIDQLNAAEGDWKNTLYDRYYMHLGDKNLTFTDHEKELIEEYKSGKRTLVVTASTDRAPYSYEENGELKGIIPDYFKQLADYIGIPYQVVIPSDRKELEEWHYGGPADLFMDARVKNEGWIEKESASITAPYITMRLAMVTRRDFNGEIHKLAVAENQGSSGIEDTLAKDAERIPVATREEGMKAVLAGKADAIFVYQYTAQEFVNRDERGLLTYTLLTDPTYEYSMVMLKDTPHEMAGIFSKAMYAMPSGTLEGLVEKYTAYQAQNTTIYTLMRIHPKETVLIGFAILLLFIALAMFIMKERANERVLEVAQRKADEMKDLAQQAQAASRAKSRFLSNMSHDIRTPLNGIIGLLKIDEAHYDDNALIQENHRKMLVAADHLLALINNVLQMSKIEDNTIELAHEPLSLVDLSNEIGTIVEMRAAEAGIGFEFGPQELPVPYVYGSPIHLCQIFLNIYGNCIKYNKAGGKVTTSLRCEGVKEGIVTYCWTISDTGVGMNEDFLKHIYEPFVQERSDARSTYYGNGLGMAIVKGFIDRMGGTIQITSREGVGTTFVVRIPFEVAEKPEEDTKQTETPKEGIRGRRLLLAEDNELNAEIAKTLLEDEGAEVTVVTDGKQAVERFQSSAPGTFDAILMDVMMPVMDGLEATRAIRALSRPDAKQIPIIAMTANAFQEDVKRCLDAGMNAHLSKPFQVKDVVETVARCIEESDRKKN